MRRSAIKVVGRDNWSDARLDKIEAAAKGPIFATKDDGAGNMDFYLRPKFLHTKPERDRILKAVQAIAPKSRWCEPAELVNVLGSYR